MSGKAKIAIAAAVVAVAWIGWDLYGSRSTDLRDFSPDDVARRETAMWRSYYDRERVLLFRQLAGTLRTQYHMPPIRSYVASYHAARAAMVFQDSHNRAEYERVLPHLRDYYAALRRSSVQTFDVDRAARLELAWWIAHRDRAKLPREDLDRLLAFLAAELYHAPAAKLMEHARRRADAMLLRDEKAEAGKPAPEDWQRIEELLRVSWRSLWEAVR